MPDRTDHRCPDGDDSPSFARQTATRSLVPCPSWCSSDERHRYVHEFELDDTSGTFVRSHELWAGEHVAVDVEERHHLDGTVTFAPPWIYNEAFQEGRTMSLSEARAVAVDLWEAADRCQQVMVGAKPEPAVVRAIRRDPSLSEKGKESLIHTYYLLLWLEDTTGTVPYPR